MARSDISRHRPARTIKLMNAMLVYYFDFVDPSGRNCRSPRAATLDRIERMGGTPVLETALKVDQAEVDSNGFLRRETVWARKGNRQPPRGRARP